MLFVAVALAFALFSAVVASFTRRARLRQLASGRTIATRPATLRDHAPDDVVCLAGRLVGPPSASIVVWSSAPTAAPPPGLELEADGQRLRIETRVEIVRGARESFPERTAALAARAGVRPPDDAHDVVRSLRVLGAGDRVVVRGRLARAPGGSEGYRGASAEACLDGFDARGVVEIAAARDPRPFALSALARAAPPIVGAVLAVVALAPVLSRSPPPDTIVPERRVEAKVPPDGFVLCGPAGDALFANGDLERFAAAYVPDPRVDSDPRCVLRIAEAAVAAHAFHRAARMARRYAALLPKEHRMDDERRQAMRCIADALATRSDGEDRVEDPDEMEAPVRLQQSVADRAMCKVLVADQRSGPERLELLGDGGFPWSDTQGMQFAKEPTLRLVAMMLVESGRAPRDEGKLAFYPDAFLQRSAVTSVHPPYGAGDDAVSEWFARTSLESTPWALLAALEAKDRPTEREDADLRVTVLGKLALFLAATGDVASARRVAGKLRSVPDPAAARRTRPPVAEIGRMIDALEAGAEPLPLRGEIAGALTAAAARGRAGDAAGAEAARRLRAALLDRSIALPLFFLELYARR